MAKTIIIGLGNPGTEYENTYHNAGFLAVNALIHALSPENPANWIKHKEIFEYATAGEIIFIKPCTFMNESGRAVREAMKKFGVAASSLSPASRTLLVIHDDSDLTIGNYKISFGRGAAGHKGVQSIINALKTNAFRRLRIGIRPVRESKRQKAGEFALKQITKNDRGTIQKIAVSSWHQYT